MRSHRALLACLPIAVLSFACAGAPVEDDGVDGEPTSTAESELSRFDLGLAPAPTQVAPPPPPSFDDLLSRYSGYDKDGDGKQEIVQLRRASVDDGRSPGSLGVVLVLVEKRIVTEGSPAALNTWLRYWRDNLALEGLGARFVETDVYAGPDHQDGLTLLALRDYVKAVRSSIPSLRGVVMVGHFPEATLILRAMRKVEKDRINGVETPNVLKVTVNRINPKSDLVLADTDGKWESVYRRTKRTLPTWKVKVENPGSTWPQANAWYESRTFEHGGADWEDFFDVRDEVTWTAGPRVGSDGVTRLNVYVGQTTPDNPEISASDESLPNPVARPELYVSRIDAKTVAYQPSAPADLDGKRALDASGKPQALRYASSGAPWSIGFEHDILFEQKLLADYFRRNHYYRRYSSTRPPWRVSTVRSDKALNLISPSNMNAFLENAGTGWGAELATDNADLADFANWAAMPATLKGIVAHSNPKMSEVSTPSDPVAFQNALGAPAFAWRRDVSSSGEVTFTPDVGRLATDDLDWKVLRSIHAGARSPSHIGAFFFHEGCDVTNPGNENEHDPYNEADYGRFNIGDATMFLLNGLSLYGRAKVFYDKPDGFTTGLALQNATLGRAWRAHFDHEAANGAIKNEVYAHKKVYYWNLLGDWTLRVKY